MKSLRCLKIFQYFLEKSLGIWGDKREEIFIFPYPIKKQKHKCREAAAYHSMFYRSGSQTFWSPDLFTLKNNCEVCTVLFIKLHLLTLTVLEIKTEKCFKYLLID